MMSPPSLRAMSTMPSTRSRWGNEGEGPHLRGRLCRHSHRQRLGLRLQAIDEGVVDGLLHEQARAGDAGLAGAFEDAAHDTGHRRIEIGVLEHDVRRLAAEFQRGGNEPVGADAADGAPGAGATGERHHAHARMLHQRDAGIAAEAGHHIEDAGGAGPASAAMRATGMAAVGVTSDGFTMMALPAASAGATFWASMVSGEFKGDGGDDAWAHRPSWTGNRRAGVTSEPSVSQTAAK